MCHSRAFFFIIANRAPNLSEIVNFSAFFLDEGICGQIGLKRAEILDLHWEPYMYAYDVATAVNSPANKVEAVQSGIMDFCDYLEMFVGHSSLGFVYIITNSVPN